jgi:hypothetical protein
MPSFPKLFDGERDCGYKGGRALSLRMADSKREGSLR